MAAADERTTIETRMDLESYDQVGDTAVFKQHLGPDHEGTFHSFAMAFHDWEYLGRPRKITMTISSAEEST